MNFTYSNRPSQLIKSLFKLIRTPVTELMKKTDLTKSNLYDAMAGRRGVPPNKQQRLEEALGLIGSLPNPDMVHYWQVGGDVSDLQIVLDAFFANGALIGGIWRAGNQGIDFKRAFDGQLFAIYDDRTIIILKRKANSLLMPTAINIGPDTIDNLVWHGGKVGSDAMISVSKDIFNKLESANLQDVKQTRKLLNCEPIVSWESVTEYLKQHWQTPKSALDILIKLSNK